MDYSEVEIWLRRKARSEARHSLAFSAGCMVLGGGVLVLFFLAIHFLVAAVQRITPDPEAAVAAAGWTPYLAPCAVLLSLFVWNRHKARSHLKHERRRHAESPWASVEADRFPVVASILSYPGASGYSGVDFLLSGPRLVHMAWVNYRKATRLRGLDFGTCARVIAVLGLRKRRVSQIDVERKADLKDARRVYAQLRDLEGILFLSTPPPGLGLTSIYRAELRAKAGLEPEEEQQPPTLSPEELRELQSSRPRGPVRVGASGDEPSVEEKAEEEEAKARAKALNKAFTEFLSSHRPPSDKEPEQEKDVGQIWDRYRKKRQ